MKRVCAYCKKTYGNSLKAAPGLPPGAISHGICPDCEPAVNAEIDAWMASERKIERERPGLEIEKGRRIK